MSSEGSDVSLPDDLADRAGMELMAASAADRQAVLQSLVAEHPRYAAALRRLHRDLGCVDDVIAEAYHTVDASTRDATPNRIGGHRVIRRLGEGAFGIVYLCAQETPVTRPVAVKVLRADTDGKQTLQRFTAERQLLASLNHPAITQVFDAGELPDGRPFFVMEYVDGAPIRRYCDDHSLDVRARVRLFADVCRGTAHAHARGIVHRDLKPANVLVVATETGPAPKIIDFGIAKAVGATASEGDARDATEAGRVVGTPGYMSPEQAAGRVDEVDARADVFSLGVMLYELLTHELPWPRGAAATTGDPPRPSQRVTASTDAHVTMAAARRQLAAELRGDLDWILAKALARERDDRYPSVAAFAEDLERHLRSETVSAGPPALGYRLRKFVRRNRAAVAGVTVATFAAATSLVVWWVLGAIADDRAEQATLAVEKLLARAGDERLRRTAQTDAVRQSLAQDALDFYDQWLRDRPTDRRLRMGRCRALLSLSQVLWQIGQTTAAERASAEAITEAEALHAERPDDLDAHSLLADAMRRNGRAMALNHREAAAIPVLAKAIEHLQACAERAPRSHSLSLSSAWRELASVFRQLKRPGDHLDALRRSVNVLEQAQSRGDPNPSLPTDLALARAGLVRESVAANQLEGTDAMLAAAMAGLDAVSIDRDRVTAAVHGARARLLRARDDVPNAIEHQALAVAANERWCRAEPGRMVPAGVLVDELIELATINEAGNRWNDANAALVRAIEVSEANVADYPDDVERSAQLERLLRQSAFRLHDRARQQDLELAERWAQRALDVHRELWRRGWRRVSRSQDSILVAMIVESRGGATDELWDRAADDLTNDGHVDTTASDRELDFTGWLGIATNRLARGRLEDAEAAIEAAARWLGDPPKHRTLAANLEWVKACVAVARRDTAALVAAAERTLAVRDTWMGRWRAGDCHFEAWRICAGSDGTDPAAVVSHRDLAARLLRSVIDELAPRVAADPDDPWYALPWGFAGLQLARIEASCGRTQEARSLLESALTGLTRVAELAHRDLWQPDVFEAAQALRASLPAPQVR